MSDIDIIKRNPDIVLTCNQVRLMTAKDGGYQVAAPIEIFVAVAEEHDEIQPRLGEFKRYMVSWLDMDTGEEFRGMAYVSEDEGAVQALYDEASRIGS